MAALDYGNVPKLQIRIVGRRRPLLAAHFAGAVVGFQVGAAWRHRRDIGLHRLVRVILDRLAGLRIEAFGPCDFLDERKAPDERARGAIYRVGEAVAILCVPKTLSGLMTSWNRLSWRNDRAALFLSGRLGLTI